MPTDDPSTIDPDSPIGLRAFISDLSWREIHLFWIGLYAGFVAVRPGRRQEPTQKVKDMLKWDVNQWYYQVAYVIGYTLKAVVVGKVAVDNADVLAEVLPVLL